MPRASTHFSKGDKETVRRSRDCNYENTNVQRQTGMRPRLRDDDDTVGGQNFFPAGKTSGNPKLQVVRSCLKVVYHNDPSRLMTIRLGSRGPQTVAELFCRTARPLFKTFVRLGEKFWQSICGFLQKARDA